MAHIHKDIDFTVSVFIVHTKRVLLHVHQKYGMWLPPGGHIELDEDPNQAALREVQEECGLSITLVEPKHVPNNLESLWQEDGLKVLVTPFYFNIHTAAPNHRHADFVYFARTDNDSVTPEHEGDQWRWWTEEELKADTTLWPSVRFHCLEALKEVAP